MIDALVLVLSSTENWSDIFTIFGLLEGYFGYDNKKTSAILTSISLRRLCEKICWVNSIQSQKENCCEACGCIGIKHQFIRIAAFMSRYFHFHENDHLVFIVYVMKMK